MNFGSAATSLTRVKVTTISRNLGLETFLIARHHALDAELAQTVLGGRHTDEAAAVFGHEIDRFGRGMFAGHDQVAFIFAVFIVHYDHHFSAPNISDYRFHGIKRRFTGRLFLFRFLHTGFSSRHVSWPKS